MTTIQTLITLSLSIILLNSSVYAGEAVVGNGGNTIFCEDQLNPAHNMTLDLYELAPFYGFKDNFSYLAPNSAKVISKSILFKLKTLNSEFGEHIEKLVASFKAESIVLNANFRNSNDLTYAMYPSDCELKTTIYQRKTSPFYILHPRWNQLSSLNQSALMIHEVIYRYSLEKNFKILSSYKVRKMTAYLFSIEFFQAANSDLLNKLIQQLETND